MSAIVFLRDMAVVLSVAAAMLLLFRRLGQPPVLGYILAGAIIGPSTPPFPLVSDAHSLEVLAEIGVVFLLFSLGIEFNLTRLWRVGARPLLCAAVEAGLMIAAAAAVGRWLGWSALESLLLGGVCALASTAIVARTLLERAGRPSGWEDLVAGMLIAEDIVAVLLIAFFSSASRFGEASLAGLRVTLLDFALLTMLILVVGLIALPRLLRLVERSGVEEVRSLAVVGICFGVAALTQTLGFSAALGAFLAGAMCSTSQARGLHETVVPFRDVFGAVFFVSVGMLIDPAWLLDRWPLALGLTAAFVALRFAVNFFALALVGERAPAAAQAALAMLPIGEFSFILAQLAQANGLSSQPIYPLAVSLCLGTTLASAALLPAASDRAIAGLLPARLDAALRSYGSWLSRAAATADSAHVWPLVRPSLIQIALNSIGITGYFVTLAAAERAYGLRSRLPAEGLLWTAAVLLCLPFLNALIRKAQAVALILWEAMRGRPPLEAWPAAARALLAGIGLAIGAWTLSLSAPLLPPWPGSASPLIVVGVAGSLLWRRTSRLYALLQAALRDAVKQAAPDAAAGVMTAFAAALSPEAVHATTFHLDDACWAVGRSLIEINMRAVTGASLLQINRDRQRLPAPDPQARLRAGDELLLIGEAAQLALAKGLLRSGALPRR